MLPSYTFAKKKLIKGYPEFYFDARVQYLLYAGNQIVGELEFGRKSYLRWAEGEIFVDSKASWYQKEMPLFNRKTKEKLGCFMFPAMSTAGELRYLNLPEYQFDTIPWELKYFWKRFYWTVSRFKLERYDGAVYYEVNHHPAMHENHPEEEGKIWIEGAVELPVILAGFVFIELHVERRANT